MTGWLTGWNKRKSHLITGATGALANYQMAFKVYKGTGSDGTETVNGIVMGAVYLGTNVRDDFGDVRFTDDDGTTLLDYWIQTLSSGSYAIIWVEVADSLANNQTVYIYYGKADATTVDSAVNTFLFADDFRKDSVLDSTKWEIYGTATVAFNSTNGIRITRGISTSSGIRCKSGVSVDFSSLRRVLEEKRSDTEINADCTFESYEASVQGNNSPYDTGNWLYNSLQNITDKILLTKKTDSPVVLANPTNKDISLFHYYELHFKPAASGVVEYYQDGTNIYSNTNEAINIGTTLYIYLTLSTNTAGRWIDHKYYCVAQYISPEPAHSTWGTEEGPLKGSASSIVPLMEALGIV